MTDLSSKPWKEQERSSTDSLLFEGDMRQDKDLPLPQQVARRKSADLDEQLDEGRPQRSRSSRRRLHMSQARERKSARSLNSQRRRQDLVRYRYQQLDKITITSSGVPQPKVSTSPAKLNASTHASSIDNSRHEISTATSGANTIDSAASREDSVPPKKEMVSDRYDLDMQSFHHSSPDPDKPHRMAHAPLHPLVQPPESPVRERNSRNDPRESLRGSLREGKRQLLNILNGPDSTPFHHLKSTTMEKVIGKKSNSKKSSDDVSTASTTGSHSSASAMGIPEDSREHQKPLVAGLEDRDLELCSRQIRMELRQAEMLELAKEAERAAASGQKRFSGRASTFGDESTDLDSTGHDEPQILPPVYAHRTVRRSMDFGTPLGNRLRRRKDSSKISVVALRDVTEVIPSFKNFHKHLRTHFSRRHVDERVLIFKEEDDPLSPARRDPPDSLDESGEENNMMHLWRKLNFGSWASRTGDESERKMDPPTDSERHNVGESESKSTDEIDVGDIIAGHTSTPSRGSKRSFLPQVRLPPGLNLMEQEIVNDSESREPANPVPRTPRSKKESNHPISSVESPSDEQRNLNRNLHLAVQDGSPHSPIVLDDVGLDKSLVRSSRGYGHSLTPPPGLPVTPRDNFDHVFQSKFATPTEPNRIQELMATRIAAAAAAGKVDDDAILSPDFATPIRLRDIRDDNDNVMASEFLSKVPQPPLTGGSEKNSLIADTPTTIGTLTEMSSHRKVGTESGDCSVRQGIRLTRRYSPHAALLHTSFDNSGSYHSPLRSNIDRNRSRVFSERHADPDGDYMSGSDEGDLSPNKQLFQSVSMPAHLSKHSPSRPPAVARGKHYVQQTVGESTTEGGSIRYRANAFGGQPSLHNENEKPSRRQLERLGETVEQTLKVDDKSSTMLAAEDSIVVIDFDGIDALKMKDNDGGSSRKTKATADFQCECLISPASSLDSEEGVRDAKANNSSWKLMEHGSMPMFSSASPSRKALAKIDYAPSKENDAFVSNYLYCSKTQEVEVLPETEPICSGSVPCQDASMPCGQIAVDSCIGDLLDTTLKFLPRKQSETKTKKLLSLSRDSSKKIGSRKDSWYDLANEKFDRLLENLIGNDHKIGEANPFAYEAPALKQRKVTLPNTPPRHNEAVYDDDFGGVVYVPSNSSHEFSESQSHHSDGRFLMDKKLARRSRAGRRNESPLASLGSYGSSPLRGSKILASQYTM